MMITNHPLRLWRVKNGHLTLEAVADKVKCGASHLSEIERGRNTPSLSLAARIHAVTGGAVTANDLVSFAHEAETPKSSRRLRRAPAAPAKPGRPARMGRGPS